MDEEKKDVKKRIDEIRDISKKRAEGELFCIPFYHKHPKLSKIVPGIVKGILYKVTAQSGVGKTQFTKEMFCITPLEFIRQNPDTNIKVKIFYFALEESKAEFIDTLLSNRLATKYNIRIEPLMLKGIHKNYLSEDILAKLEDCEKDVQYYMDHIEIVDSEYNPTGMYKYCRHYSEQVGKHIWENRTFQKRDSSGTIIETVEPAYVRYEPDDPNLHVIVIADHISLIYPEYDKKREKMLTTHEAIAKWSTEYCKKQITKHWNWTVVNIQQQEQSKEAQQFTMTGKSIIEKTEPSLDGLANNKEIQRDDYVILSVYSPDKFGFEEYHQYDINRFRDTFRAVKVLKNRIGSPNGYVHFLFDGATNRFNELPKPGEDDEKLKQAYATADYLLGRG
jgi:replicative DNA helicase